jgi:hypothetical protein
MHCGGGRDGKHDGPNQPQLRTREPGDGHRVALPVGEAALSSSESADGSQTVSEAERDLHQAPHVSTKEGRR